MISKQRLFTPGPTPLSPVVQEALSRPIPHHRTDEFRGIMKACAKSLQAFMKTTDEVLIVPASGTGAMEAALVNAVSPGDTVLVLVAGSFGERWAALGKTFGLNVKRLEAPWGEAVPPEALAKALAEDPKIKAVFCQHNESSTGVRSDLQGYGRLTAERPDTLLVVDAISGAGAMALETSAWGLDIVAVGSQKALALPPGLVFISASAKAWARMDTATTPRYYFDLRRERKAQASGEASFTPAISLVVALRAALEQLERQGGVDALVKNAGTLAAMTRAAAKAIGVPLVAPRDGGDALTSLYPPAGIESGAIVKSLKQRFGTTVAGGQGKLEGKIFRVAHLGYYDATDMFGLLATLEIVLQGLGHKFELGSGVAVAQRELIARSQ